MNKENLNKYSDSQNCAFSLWTNLIMNRQSISPLPLLYLGNDLHQYANHRLPRTRYVIEVSDAQ
jgi:hypothetical protein